MLDQALRKENDVILFYSQFFEKQFMTKVSRKFHTFAQIKGLTFKGLDLYIKQLNLDLNMYDRYWHPVRRRL